MTATATNSPFDGVRVQHRFVGKGKKRHVEYRVVLPEWRTWVDPACADVVGVGPTLDEASVDYAHKMSALLLKLGHIGMSSSPTTVKFENVVTATSVTTFTL